jgi:hypothetical protein
MQDVEFNREHGLAPRVLGFVDIATYLGVNASAGAQVALVFE